MTAGLDAAADPNPGSEPTILRGGLIRRGFALFIDLLIAQMLVQILATALFPLSGGRIIDTASFFTACESTTTRPDGIDIPAEFHPTGYATCTKSLVGFPTARLAVISRTDPTTHTTTTLSYKVASNGRPIEGFDLAVFHTLALVLMRWAFERRGSRSPGRRWLSLEVTPQFSNWAEIDRVASLDRRYLLFGLPVLIAFVVDLGIGITGLIFGPIRADIASVLTFFGNLPVTVAALAAMEAIGRGRDAYYDEEAGTTVARLVEGVVRVLPDGRNQRRQRWFRWSPWRQHRSGARIVVPWLSGTIAAVLVLVYAAEALNSFSAGGGLDIGIATLAHFGGANGNLVQLLGQWYRLITAIFIHASPVHVLANVGVLLLAGCLLEGTIGRAWFLATFLLGGVVASLASITFNVPGLVGVGASGADTAVVAAGLVVSAGLAASKTRRWLRALCLACLLAALQATGKFAWGTVDRVDHLGGAAAGVLIGCLILALWRSHRPGPALGGVAAACTVVASAALFLLIPWTGFGDTTLASLFVPADQFPKNDADWVARSADLVRRYPKDFRAHLARAIAAGDDSVEREREIATAIALNARFVPDNSKAYAQNAYGLVGSARQAARDWRAAEDLYNRALALSLPENPELLVKRASVEEDQGRFEDALRDFKTLSDQNPDHASYRAGMAEQLFALGRTREALSLLDDAALAPSDDRPLLQQQRGWIGFFGGRADKALDDLQESLQRRPTFAYGALWLDIAAVRLGQDDRIKTSVGQLDMTQWPSPIVRFYLGEIDRDTLMSSAKNNDPVKQTEQECEADFYSGEWDLMHHDPGQAAPLLQTAARICPTSFYEWSAVHAELRGDAGFRTP